MLLPERQHMAKRKSQDIIVRQHMAKRKNDAASAGQHIVKRQEFTIRDW